MFRISCALVVVAGVAGGIVAAETPAQEELKALAAISHHPVSE